MTIRVVYMEEPSFPATDQHPDAVRHQVGNVWVDAIGGEPSEEDVLALFAQPLPDLQPYQFWAMLEMSGYKDDLDAFVSALDGQDKIVARAKLDRALSFRRDNELVEAARAAIGISADDLDALWLQAASI